MSQQNTNENKSNNLTPHSKRNSQVQEHHDEIKLEKIDHQQHGISKNYTNPSQNQSFNKPYLYQYDKLPDIHIKQIAEIQNDFEKLRQNQRSSESLYRHNNDQKHLFNPYIQKGNNNRSFSQKSLPQAVILQQVKQERIIVQEQNQMLINRLRKLRQEELQLQKIAEDTSKRAEKLFQQKKNYQKKREEEQQRLEQQDEIGFTQPKKQYEMRRVQMAIEEKMKEKKKGFYEVKQIIAEEQLKKAQEEKIEQIKKLKEVQKLKREQYLQEKKQKVEKEIQRQRVKEEALLSFAKFEAKDFERREQEMLQRIQRTQLINEQAKLKLKDSITLDISQYENRYLKEKENRQHKKSNMSDISVSSINSNLNHNHKHSLSNRVGQNYNSKSISQQILKIASNGQTSIITPS